MYDVSQGDDGKAMIVYGLWSKIVVVSHGYRRFLVHPIYT